MPNDDYYTAIARQQWAQLDAERAQIHSALAYAKANGDDESARNAVQELADVEAKRASLVALHEQYRASQAPAQQPELTQEEKNALPWDKMNYGHVFELASASKYGVDPDAFRAGIQEVARRRARGE